MRDVTIRLDRSKYFSTVHGERQPGDPLYDVAHMQDGLPFDSKGDLVEDDGETEPKTFMLDRDANGIPIMAKHYPLYTAEMREKLAKKKERLKKIRAGEKLESEKEESPASDRAGEVEAVNLVAWLKGQDRYEPWLLFAAASERYSKRYTKVSSLVTDLVLDEKLIPEEELAPHLAKMLPQAA